MTVETSREPSPSTVPESRIVAESEGWPTATGRPRMSGRVVFVTGGTRGIGAAIAKRLAADGAAKSAARADALAMASAAFFFSCSTVTSFASSPQRSTTFWASSSGMPSALARPTTSSQMRLKLA